MSIFPYITKLRKQVHVYIYHRNERHIYILLNRYFNPSIQIQVIQLIQPIICQTVRSWMISKPWVTQKVWKCCRRFDNALGCLPSDDLFAISASSPSFDLLENRIYEGLKMDCQLIHPFATVYCTWERGFHFSHHSATIPMSEDRMQHHSRQVKIHHILQSSLYMLSIAMF